MQEVYTLERVIGILSAEFCTFFKMNQGVVTYTYEMFDGDTVMLKCEIDPSKVYTNEMRMYDLIKNYHPYLISFYRYDGECYAVCRPDEEPK